MITILLSVMNVNLLNFMYINKKIVDTKLMQVYELSYSNLYIRVEIRSDKCSTSLKEFIVITFTENGPVVFESSTNKEISKERNINLFIGTYTALIFFRLF